MARSTSGWNSGDATSQSDSNAVLSASAVQTAMMASTTASHSPRLMRSAMPAPTAATVATAWIQALCCVDSVTRMPRRACRKLRILALTLNRSNCTASGGLRSARHRMPKLAAP